MKKILLSAIIAIVYTSAFAQLKINENFLNPPFSASGNLGTQNSWAGVAAGGDVQVSFLSTNTAAALVYPGYTSGRSYITIGTSSRDPYKPFNSAISSTVNSTFYISFVVEVASSSNTTSTNNADPVLALRTDATGPDNQNFCYFYIADAPGNNLKFGISKDANVDGTYASGSFVFATTYLIVIRYDVSTTTTSDDRIFMWVNPLLTAEPATSGYSPSANTTQITTGFDGGTTSPTPDATFTGNINALQLFQTSNGATAKFDAFKVATGTSQVTQAANAAAAWSNLAPQGAPLPVKLGGIKAYEKQSGIQIDWTAYSEENLSNYQVERSADGKTFEAIGNVAARNSLVETKYGWYDASPLPGVNFYRLKSIDTDSKSAYSSIVRVSLSKESKAITIYPNPVQNGYLSFHSADLSRGDYWIKISNAAGQQLYSRKINHSGGAINQTIELPKSMQSGMYTLQLENQEARIMSKSFIVQ